jgi:hypothetical protein
MQFSPHEPCNAPERFIALIPKVCTTAVESTFATVRHRTVRSKGCLSNKTALAMVFKLAQAAEKHWRRLDGQNQLPKVVLGVRAAAASKQPLILLEKILGDTVPREPR